MTSSEVQVANLLYRYAEYIDAGDFAGAAALFTHAKLKIAGHDKLVDAAGARATWDRYVILYPDGTPRTKHVITNPIIDVDEKAGTATIRSYYTVMQKVDGKPFQPIVAGRYYDEFERVDGVWRWSYRDYSMMDIVGDSSSHLKGI